MSDAASSSLPRRDRDSAHPPADRRPTHSDYPGPDTADMPREYGGRKGPDPVRYGDWEKNGRCIDF